MELALIAYEEESRRCCDYCYKMSLTKECRVAFSHGFNFCAKCEAAKIAELEKERDAYKKAKAENDDRFQIRCLELESENKRLQSEVERLEKQASVWSQGEIHLAKAKAQQMKIKLDVDLQALRAENEKLRDQLKWSMDSEFSLVDKNKSLRTALAESQGRELALEELRDAAANFTMAESADSCDCVQTDRYEEARLDLARKLGAVPESSTPTPDVAGLIEALERLSVCGCIGPCKTTSHHEASAALKKYRGQS